MNCRATPRLASFLFPIAFALGAPLAAQPCEQVNDWFATIPAGTVCGCTQTEAEQIARLDARVVCAADPAAVNCAPLACNLAGNRCETVVTGSVQAVPCRTILAATNPACPGDCPNGRAVECTVPGQRLLCDCACRNARCGAVTWNVSRTVSFCTRNREKEKIGAAYIELLAACGAAANAVPCAGRLCPGAAPPPCMGAVRGDVTIGGCRRDPLCPANELRCTATAAVACTCRC